MSGKKIQNSFNSITRPDLVQVGVSSAACGKSYRPLMKCYLTVELLNNYVLIIGNLNPEKWSLCLGTIWEIWKKKIYCPQIKCLLADSVNVFSWQVIWTRKKDHIFQSRRNPGNDSHPTSQDNSPGPLPFIIYNHYHNISAQTNESINLLQYIWTFLTVKQLWYISTVILNAVTSLFWNRWTLIFSWYITRTCSYSKVLKWQTSTKKQKVKEYIFLH